MNGTRNSSLLVKITVLVVICFFVLPAQGKYGGGTGEPNDPYLIYDANQMNAIGADSNDWDKHFKLMANIDLGAYTGTSFNIIGTDYYNPFTGVFDGSGHTISNFTYTSTGTSWIGLFGYVSGESALIKDMGLIDPNVDAGTGYYVGALVGWLRDGTISNCYAERSSVSGRDFVGGLVGYLIEGTIANCYSTASVSGEDHVGGLVGRNRLGTITNCYSTGSVAGHRRIGGLVGWNFGTITNCYSTGSVSGNYWVGGLVGSQDGTITNCYSSASVAGDVSVGGLAGHNLGTIANSYSEGSVSGNNYVGGLVGENRETITNCYSTAFVSGTRDVGGLVGYTYKGSITNSYATGSVHGNEYVGGLLGYNYEGKITNCYSAGSVQGDEKVGGLVGWNHFGPVSNCYSTGSVLGEWVVGGLVGWNWLGRVSNCYSTGDVNGSEDFVGGLVGVNWGSVSNCYSTGDVSGNLFIGGLCGANGGTITNCFWDIETSGQTTSDGGTGKTTAEMQTATTFIAWGCVPVWTIDEGKDYPRLWWESAHGEAITPQLYLGGGSGELNDPYLIYTAEQLNMIGLIECEWDKHFKLMADIDLSGYTGTEFNIIGTGSIYCHMGWCYPVGTSFCGVFDGNDHTISNFTYNSTETDCMGLFGYVRGSDAEIKNLGLIDPNVDAGTGISVGSLVGWLSGRTITNCYVEGGSVSGDDRVGGLVGSNFATITNCYVEDGRILGDFHVGGLVGTNEGTITNCYSQGDVSGWAGLGGLVGNNFGTITNSYATGSASGVWFIGGLVGAHYERTITNSYATGSVSGKNYVGGLVGCNFRGTISDCYATGSVTASADCVGGLVGDNGGGFMGVSIITNCYSTGSVSGDDNVGGLVGINYSTINNCYSTGSILGDSYVGGLVGDAHSGATVTNSFWDTETSGQNTSAGGTGKTTAKMQMMSTFTDAGWDFVGETFNGIKDIWFIPQGEYPHLWWEGMQVPMKLTPRTLNCRSKGNWVKAHLTLPQGFTVADVDPDRLAVLHSFGFQSLPLYIFVNDNELVQIEAAFEREAVCSLAGDWPDELTVAGFLTDGNIFLGTSTVRMITPGLKAIEELASCWLQGDCVHPTWCDRIDMNRDSLVNLLDYALLLNSQVEFVSE